MKLKLHFLIAFFVLAFGYLLPVNAQTTISSNLLINEPGCGSAMTGSHILYVKLTPEEITGVALPWIDANFTLSDVPIAAWADYSIAIRFNGTNGYIDCRNGGSNAAVNQVPFVFRDTYEVWIVTTVASKTYSVYVQGPSMANYVQIASNYGYRKTTVTQLNRWSSIINPATGNPNFITASNFTYVSAIGDDGLVKYATTFTLTDYFNQVISGATISINTKRIITDAAGVASINLPDGTYNYSIALAGYLTKTGSISINGSTQSRTESLTFASVVPVPIFASAFGFLLIGIGMYFKRRMKK